MVFNGAIDHIIQNNPKARQNPRGLSQLDGYKRGLVNSRVYAIPRVTVSKEAVTRHCSGWIPDVSPIRENDLLALRKLCFRIEKNWFLRLQKDEQS
jgi:hypothetical protein